MKTKNCYVCSSAGEGLLETFLYAVWALFQKSSKVCGAHEVSRAQTEGWGGLCYFHLDVSRSCVGWRVIGLFKCALQLRDQGPEVMEELITVDAVGCFEGEDDYEEDRNKKEVPVLEKVGCLTSGALQTLIWSYESAELLLKSCFQDASHKEIISKETTGYEVYDPDIQYGEWWSSTTFMDYYILLVFFNSCFLIPRH